MKKVLFRSLLLLAGGLSVAHAQAPATLLLSAPVGSVATLAVASTTKTTLEADQIAVVPGVRVNPSQLAEARQRVAEKLKNPTSVITMPGKVTEKITARDTAGATSSTMRFEVYVPVPGKSPLTIGIQVQQKVARDGSITVQKLQSNMAPMQAVFDAMSSSGLQQTLTQSGANLSGGYGLRLKPGTVRQTQVTISPEDIVKMTVSAVPDSATRKVMQQAKSVPTTLSVTTRYQGKNAQGQHVVLNTQSYNPWKITLPPTQANGHTLSMTMEMTQHVTQQLVYRPDGLPGAGTKQRTLSTIQMAFTVDGIQETSRQTTQQDILIKGHE